MVPNNIQLINLEKIVINGWNKLLQLIKTRDKVNKMKKMVNKHKNLN